jgi:mRNA interferase MazF
LPEATSRGPLCAGSTCEQVKSKSIDRVTHVDRATSPVAQIDQVHQILVLFTGGR